jgi:outer membrane protein assembly factor BamB
VTKPSGATKAEATATPSPTPAPKPTTLYFAVAQTVYAFDLQTGAKRWSFDTGAAQGQYGVRPIGALAATPDTLVFLDPRNQSVYALSAVDGSLKWKSDAVHASPYEAGSLDTLVMTPNVVIASSTCVQCPNSTSAYDLVTGKALWSQPIGGTGWAVGDGIVYKTRDLPGSDAEPVTNGTLQALNPTTGAVIWQATGHAFSQPTLIGSTLYALADDALHAFDAKTGAETWTHALTTTNSAHPSPSMTGQGNELYFNDGTTLFALDGITHTVQWQVPLNGLCTGITRGVIACYVDTGSGSSYLTGLDTSTGTVLWQYTDNGPNIPWGAAADNDLFLVNNVHGATWGALDAQKGTVRWTMNSPSGAGGHLTLDGVIYFAGMAAGEPDKLYAVSDTDGSTLWTWTFQAAAYGNNLLAIG